jgi:hypothetical protein
MRCNSCIARGIGSRVATIALLALALIIGEMGGQAAGPQPGLTSILPTVAQLGEGWTSNRVVVLIDPLSSPREIAATNENQMAWLQFGRDLLKKDARREAYAMVRYYGGGSGGYHTNSLVFITRWKSRESTGDDWGRDKETKDPPGNLSKVGEEVRFYQRDGMHNNIAFRRGKYLIDVECPTAYGIEHLKRLAEALDNNLLKAQEAVNKTGLSEGDAKLLAAGLKGERGVVLVAPEVSDLGAGWTERRIVYAVDPLDEPAETVNESASQDSANRSRLLTQVRVELEQASAVGMGYFGYGFGNLVAGKGRYDLYLCRFPDQNSLEKEWGKYARQEGTQTQPEVGEAAVWLARSADDHDYRLVVRSGSCLMRLECTAKQEKEKLVQLANKATERISKPAMSSDARDLNRAENKP